MNALDTIRLITQVAMEGNMAAGAVFGLIRGIRDAWPSGTDETLPTDRELIAEMKTKFSGNEVRRLELVAEIEAIEATLPPGE